MRISTRPSVVPMPHSPEEKSRALARVLRVKGQLEALERALEAGLGMRPGAATDGCHSGGRWRV